MKALLIEARGSVAPRVISRNAPGYPPATRHRAVQHTTRIATGWESPVTPRLEISLRSQASRAAATAAARPSGVPQPRPPASLNFAYAGRDVCKIARMRYAEDHTFRAVAKCIYCNATDGLSDEHIIAYSLGGDYILPDASCAKCRDMTAREELWCARGIFGALRIAHEYPTRRPQERPKEVTIDVESGGQTKQLSVPVDQMPTAPVIMPIFPTAGVLVGREPSIEIPDIRYQFIFPFPPDHEERLQRLRQGGPTKIKVNVPYGLNPFMCLLAKIGHGFAVAAHGLESFTPLLPDYILDRDRRLSHVIGSTTQVITPAPDGTLGVPSNPMHAWQVGIRSIGGKHYVVTLIQLFRYLGAPVYEVVAGEATDALVREVRGA